MDQAYITPPKPEVWAIVELMGHVTLAGRLDKPGEFGGLWQIDVPVGDTFATEMFGSSSVYRIRIVSEEIARAHNTRHQIIEYDAPIITRQEHEAILDRAREEISNLQRIAATYRDRLTAINALPDGNGEWGLDEE